ncbi:hypothetical protein VaNZ11_009764, partial [Volvox africanus]
RSPQRILGLRINRLDTSQCPSAECRLPDKENSTYLDADDLGTRDLSVRRYDGARRLPRGVRCMRHQRVAIGPIRKRDGGGSGCRLDRQVRRRTDVHAGGAGGIDSMLVCHRVIARGQGRGTR